MNQITNVNNPVVVFVPFGNSSTASSFQVSFQANVYDREIESSNPATINITITNPLSSSNQLNCVTFDDSLSSQAFSLNFSDASANAGIEYKVRIISSTTNGSLFDSDGTALASSALTSMVTGFSKSLNYSTTTGFYNHSGTDSFSFSIVAINIATSVWYLCIEFGYIYS